MNRGGSRPPLVVAVLAVLVLVGVVAIAATGSTPSGTGDTRPPADVVLDTVLSLGLLALIPAAALLVYGLMQRKAIAREMASRRYPRTSVVAFVLVLLIYTVVSYYGFTHADRRPDEPVVVEVGGETRPAAGGPDAGDAGLYEPEFAWIPVLVVVTLAAIAIVAYVLAARRRDHEEPPAEQVAEDVADELEDTLDDLRAEPDARRAVIAAFARLERALGSSGLPRRPAETAAEYVARILAQLEVDPLSVRRLTDLFTTAKFSQHVVDAAMKKEAISALAQVRDELREAARRRRQEQAEAARVHAQATTS